MLDICAESMEERTSSEHRNLLYLFPPNLSSSGAADAIDGVEMIEMEVTFTSTNSRTLKTRLMVSTERLEFTLCCIYSRPLSFLDQYIMYC